LLDGDFLGLLRMGANIYYLAKLAVPSGISIQDAGAAFQGITTPEFQAKLDAKGDGLEEKLAKLGGYWHG
jgi:protocatechuate 4,5-dioxygenase alpha chain